MSGTKQVDISVLIPVFNGIQYIQRGLDCICHQSLQTIEIIVVDDGSTDGSGAMLDAYARKDARITVIHQQNAGVGMARNVAMEHAQGEYLYFFDIDDTIAPTLLKSALTVLRQQDCQLVIFGFKVIDGTNEEDVVLPDKQLLSPSEIAEHYVNDILSVRYGSGFLWNKLYRADIIRRHALQFNHFKVQEDELFNIAYMKHVHSVVLMPNVYYTYYLSNSGNSRSRFLPNMHEIILAVHQAFVGLQQALSISDGRFNEFVNRRTFSALLLWTTFHLFHRDSPWSMKERREIIRTIAAHPIWKEVNHPVGLEQRLYAASLTAGHIHRLAFYVYVYRNLRKIKKVIFHAQN